MSRETFEAWYKEKYHGYPMPRCTYTPDRYVFSDHQNAWEGWQAAMADQADQLTIAKQRIAELEKDCDILAYNLDAAHTINKNQVQNCEIAYRYAFLMRDLMINHNTEIERLRSALKNLLADTQHKDHECTDKWCPVWVAKESLDGVAE